MNLSGTVELLNEWKRQSLVLIHMAVRSALTTAQYQTQPPAVVTFLQVEFDYSLLSFRPIDPPKVVHMSDLPYIVGPDHAIAVMEQYESFRATIQRNTTEPEQRTSKIHFAFLRCLDTGSLIPMNIPPDIRRYDWEEMQAAFSSKSATKRTQPTPGSVNAWPPSRSSFNACIRSVQTLSRLCNSPTASKAGSRSTARTGLSFILSLRLGWGRSAVW